MNYDYAWDDSDSDGQVMAKQYGLKPPLTRPLEATPPRTSPSRALGTLAKLASVTEITEQGSTLSGDSCVSLLNGLF
jgi:hypothetical protein